MSDPRFPHDPDLEFLKDRELLELATLLRTRRSPEPPLDPAFRSSLRRDLRRKHYELLEPSMPWWRRLTSGPGLAWSGATAGAVAIAVALVFALHPPPGSQFAVVSSPLQGMRNVAVVLPMKLTFQTEMDHQSVQNALQIEPATSVTYSWQGNTLYVQPVAGQLAPNTQYRLMLNSDAKTKLGAPIQPATITFVTAAATGASPAPSVSPTPAPSGLAVAGQQQLGPAGPVAPAWSPDGATIYFAGADGSLQSEPRAGGSPALLGVPGVRQVAVSPDGSRLAVLTTAGVVVLKVDGTSIQPLLPVPDALAVGWQQGKPLLAVPEGVFELKQNFDRRQPGTAFTVPAQAVAFSPDGGRLLYLDNAGRVHLVTLAGGQDTPWPAGVATLPAWSQDGSRVAYLGSGGLTLAAPDGSAATSLATLEQLGQPAATGVTVAWSDGAVLTAGPAGLSGVDTTMQAPVQVASGSFSALSASPDNTTIAYVQDGSLWTAAVQHPGVLPKLESEAAVALKTFMDARVAGDGETAQKFLSPGAAQQYQKTSLLFAGKPRLRRWFGVFQQARTDGTVLEVVRLVLVDEHDVEIQQLDETLTLRANPDGSFTVIDAKQTPARAVDAGPEVVGISVSSGQVTVTFDSDLKPETAAGINLGTATPSYANRVVTLALNGATPGEVLTLTIPASVQDLSGRSAAQPLTVQIVVPPSS